MWGNIVLIHIVGETDQIAGRVVQSDEKVLDRQQVAEDVVDSIVEVIEALGGNHCLRNFVDCRLSLLSPPAFLPYAGITQRPPHSRSQARQIAFYHVVVSAGPQHGHGGVFSDAARYHDEGNIMAALLQEFQSRRSIEAGHAVVGKDDIPVLHF